MSLFRVKARWTGFTGSPGYSIFHFNAPDDAAGPTAEQCSQAVTTFFTTFSDRLPSAVKVQCEPVVERIDTPSGELIDFVDVPTPTVVGGLVSGGFSAAAGACISWSTRGVRNGRRVRGRTFIVPLGGAMYEPDGTLLGAAATDIQDAANILANDFAGLVIYARPTAPGAADGVAFDVSGARVADKAAVLKSRRD